MTTLKFTRTSQPQGPLILDATSSLAKDLVGVFNGSSRLQALDGKRNFTNVAGSSFNGRTATFDGASSYITSAYPATALVDACTIVAIVTPSAYPTLSICTPFASFETADQSRGSRCLGITTTGGLALGSQGSNGFNAMISGGIVAIGIPSVVIGSTPNGLTGNAWLNGVKVLSGTINSGNGLYGNGTPTQVLSVGRGFGVTAAAGSYGYFQGSVQLALVYNRVLSDAEVKSLSENPWQVFAPVERQIWVGINSTTASTGDLVAVETGADTANFTATSTATIYGSLGATEAGSDTLAFVGASLAQGALNSAETGADSSAITGTLLAQASLAASEIGADTVTLTGTLLAQASLAASETGADTSAIIGALLAQASLATSETGADTAAFTGSQQTISILSAIETGADSVTFTGLTLVQAAIAGVEGGFDTAALLGTALAQGALVSSELGSDTAAFTGSQQTTANLAATEIGTDTAGISGVAVTVGALGATEVGGDSAALSGKVYVVGILATLEVGGDTAVFTGGNPNVYVPSLRRMVSPARSSSLSASPYRGVPAFQSIARSVNFTSPSRAILLAPSPSRTVALTSPERSEV